MAAANKGSKMIVELLLCRGAGRIINVPGKVRMTGDIGPFTHQSPSRPWALVVDSEWQHRSDVGGKQGLSVGGGVAVEQRSRPRHQSARQCGRHTCLDKPDSHERHLLTHWLLLTQDGSTALIWAARGGHVLVV